MTTVTTTITSASNPIVSTTGLTGQTAEIAKQIRNARFQLLAVKPKVSREAAYIWRAVAKEVSPKEALQRAITKVFTDGFNNTEIKAMDKQADAIVNAIQAGIKAQEALANMVQTEESKGEEFVPGFDITETHTYGMGLCVDCQACHHFWEINRSGSQGNSPKSKGLCLHCGKVGQFFNSIHSQIQAKRQALLDRELVDEVGMEVEDEEEDEMNALAMQDAMNAMIESTF